MTNSAASNLRVRPAFYDKDPNRTTPAKPFQLGEGIIGTVAETGQAAIMKI